MARRLNRASYTRLCMEVLIHRCAYYCHHRPLISDFHYDQLEKDLIHFEGLKPSLIHPESPTKTVGADDIKSYPRSAANAARNFVYGIWPFDETEWRTKWLPHIKVAKKVKKKRAPCRAPSQ